MDVLFMLFVFVCVYWCPPNIVLCFCFIFLRLVYHMLPVSLDCPFFLFPLRYSLAFIAHLRVLIYLEISQKIMFVYICIVIEYSITKWERVDIPVTSENTWLFNSKMINPKVHGHILTFRKKDDVYEWIILYVKR